MPSGLVSGSLDSITKNIIDVESYYTSVVSAKRYHSDTDEIILFHYGRNLVTITHLTSRISLHHLPSMLQWKGSESVHSLGVERWRSASWATMWWQLWRRHLNVPQSKQRSLCCIAKSTPLARKVQMTAIYEVNGEGRAKAGRDNDIEKNEW